jgi:formate hydrogenlyase transcriptional activator
VEFSHDIASARTRDDLSRAIHHSLRKLGQIRAYFIRTINEDGLTLSPFMHDQEVFYKDDPAFIKLLNTKIKKTEGITGRVLGGEVPLLIDFVEEVKQGNSDDYIEFWKGLGPQKPAFQKMVGVPLRMGTKELGVLWVITDTINMLLLEGISAQISVAISNTRSNEEIAQREEEKSILLSLSDEIAALRSRDDLLHVVNTKIKTLFSIKEFVIAQINEDGTTYSALVLDIEDTIKNNKDFKEVASGKYKVSDPVFGSIMNAEDAVMLDVDRLAEKPGMPPYVGFWKTAGLRRVLGMAMRVGGRNTGCAFLYIDEHKTGEVRSNLLKAVCAQLSVAVSNILANEQILAYKQMLEVENDHLREQIKTIYNFSDIIGSGPEMQKIYRLMSLVTESSSTVLLLGETGTGKELIARAIHNSSARKNKLMIKVNCAALPANLIESELFGHERGSFTGAVERRIGKFELANNSTLFLDEIGEMPLEMQVKLLRVLQERELERVGGKTTIKVDVRIIAATNRNLEQEVKAGRFRSDLYYRLNVFPITLPPLRERMEDIVPLANFFLSRYSKNTGKRVTSISTACIRQLKTYSWPGNVRELEHLIERSILLTESNVLTEVQLPNARDEEGADKSCIPNKTLQQLERAYIIEVLKKCSGRIAGKSGAAEVLEIPSTTLHSKMKKLGIAKGDYF